MKEIDFMNKGNVLGELKRSFINALLPNLPITMKGMDDPERVFNFFSGRTWMDIINTLDLSKDAYALDLGVGFLDRKDFLYYIPLYIYASLLNRTEFRVFEADFIQYYLCPDHQNSDCFLNFVLGLTDEQLNIISRFMRWESDVNKLSFAKKACIDFWDLYL